MPLRRPVRSCLGAGLLLLAFVAGCGVEGEAPEKSTPDGLVDPSKAEAVLRSYLDDDRCDLLSDRILLTIGLTPDDGRKRCADGELPVDALVRPGDYKISSAEIIDEEGLITIRLEDGGERDYTLVPGGSDGFLVDEVESRSETEIGKPLRLDARAAVGADPVDARITVLSLERVPRTDLSEDEFVSTLDKYYKARIRVRSRSDLPITVGSLGFSLSQINGVKVAETRVPYSRIGGLLPSTVQPGETVAGYLFFAVPNVEIAEPTQVVFQIGDDEDALGAKLVWKKPGVEAPALP